MKWSPYQFYTSSPQEFNAAQEGYLNEREELSENARLQTFYTVRALGFKIKKPEELWKLSGDKELVNDKLVMTKEMLQKIKEAHGIN